QNHTILGNKDLKPETGVRFEHSLQWNTTISKVKSTIGLSFAYNDLHNMITLALVNGHQVLREYRNIEQYRNFISGLSVVNQWNNLSVRQGVSYTYVQQGIYIPQHQIVEYSFLGSYYWHRVKTRLNVNYKYSSTQPLISTDNQVLFTDAIHVATMSVQRTFFNQSLQVQLGVKNIFNIQNSGVNGATDLQGNPHVSTQGLNLFPGRSIFIDLNYNL
ncbi:MAG: TonB-dependent receptor, partial [Chitinophagaceae bacterium]|nr:TonB-dependent receptor [Chitinophagaceae bacterium]